MLATIGGHCQWGLDQVHKEVEKYFFLSCDTSFITFLKKGIEWELF